MTKDEFNRASADTVFVFTAHLKNDAFGQKQAESQTATLRLLANAWLDVQPGPVKNGVLAVSTGAVDSFGRATASILGEKGAVDKLFREFANDITHLGFAEYKPPAIEQTRTKIPGFAKRK